MRGTLILPSVNVTSTNAAEFDAGLDDVFTRIAGRYDRLCDVFSLLAPDSSVDAYAISFGMKICDRVLVLQEAFRVLKPGGRMYCLEASRIPVSFIHAAYLRYMDWCLPLIARISTGGDRGAYDYLLRGIHDFPCAPLFSREIESLGFQNVSYRYMTFGIVALHVASKPTAEQFS